ncbi:MAG TPA: hypothetical protein VJ951_12895, partial [Bacteroidales bacterium]|nr:hypothetical protein [Bacteroidales bacterium]
MRFFGWIIICVIFFSVSISYGQTDSTQWPDRISISMALGASKPLNAFDRKYSGTPWSVSVQMGIKPNQDRFQFIEFDFNYQRLTEYQNIFPIQSPQGGLIDINHSTRSNLLFLGAGYRYEFDQFWYIIPKVSLSFGGCNAYVFTSLRDNF